MPLGATKAEAAMRAAAPLTAVEIFDMAGMTSRMVSQCYRLDHELLRRTTRVYQTGTILESCNKAWAQKPNNKDVEQHALNSSN